MSFLRKYIGIFAVIFLSFWAIRPLFHTGFFPMHDDTQVARVFEMGKALKDGMFPVRWVPDLGYGYGYPIFNFYAPLAYYVGGLFTFLGFDALIATKIMMGIGILLSGIFMYLLAREFWGEMGGVLSGLFYLYAPYHALDIYVRGDVAEFWAYAFIPLMFWGFYKVFNSPRRSPSATFEVGYLWKWVVTGSIGYAGVILSHNLTAMMVTPLLAIVVWLYCYTAYRKKNIHTTYYLILTTVLGLALSAFYWIPALLELGYTNVLSQIGGGADFRDHFVCINQLWESNWGFGGSAPGCMLDGMSFMIGKLHIVVPFVVFVLVLISLIKNKYYNFNKNYIVVFLSLAGFALSTFFTLEISRFVWETVPVMAFLQYPWRFLLLASFFTSFLAGSVLWFFSALVSTSKESRSLPRHLRGVTNWWAAGIGFAILVFLLIYFNSKLFQPQTIVAKTVLDYTSEYALKWTASKISDEFLPPDFKKPKLEREIAKRPAIAPYETAVQKISNTITLSGIVILGLGIIIFKRKS